MQQHSVSDKPRIVLVGAVDSTAQTLSKLVEHQANVVGVFGYESENTDHVSGYVELAGIAASNGYSYFPFKKINSEADRIRSLKPDYVFVVGLSQLVSAEILAIPNKCCIGFHPTSLPRGRGRAPLAWLILDEQSEGSATFFVLADGVDNGAIVAQKGYSVSEKDDVASLINKLMLAMDSALDELLPSIYSNSLKFLTQDESLATYYEKRSPDDGLVDWNRSADQINRLIRATTDPYPGAYSFANDQKITIYAAERYSDQQVIGVVGRIVLVLDKGSFVVQCGENLLKINKYVTTDEWGPRVGATLGYSSESEIYRLKQRVDKLEQLLLNRHTTLE